MTRHRLAVLGAAVALATATACSSGGNEKVAPSTTLGPTTTTIVSTTAVVTIPGTPRTTSTIATTLDSGEARLTGTVTGDDDLTGVVVRVEHFVADAVASTEVPTSGGRWSLDGIPGGRYRVTAFRTPDLGSAGPDVFFLGASETRTVNLTVARANESGITATLTPTPPPLDKPLRLAVQVGAGAIDSQGRIISAPRPGVGLQLVPTGGFVLDSQPAQITDGNGTATWDLHCDAAGSFPVFLVVNNTRSTINIPPCS